MASRLPVVPLLGALIHLTRHQPDAHSAADALLAALRAALAGKPLRIEASPQLLSLDSEPVALEVPGATLLSEQLLLHSIAAVELPGELSSAELAALARLLAAFPGSYANAAEVAQAIAKDAPRIRLAPARNALGVYDFSWGPGERSAQQRAGELPPEQLPAELDLPLQESGLARLPGTSAPVPRPSIGALVQRGREALAKRDWTGLLDAGLAFMEAEDYAPSERTGETYRLELRRLISRDELEQLAGLLHGERRQEVIGLLRRFGAESTELLVKLLTVSTNLSERRGYFTAISQMGAGAEAVIGQLEHSSWYVVRNAAELCGEMELSEAVPALGRQTRHQDERVRRSVAGALARIGTPLALQWLARMLSDPAPTVRRQALMQLAGQGARELCPAIAELLEGEADPDVQREAILALGRIGTPEAVRLLAGWTSPATGLFGRKEVELRLLLVRGLTLAGPAAVQALSNLTRDETPEVRAAAHAALEAMRP